MTSAVIGAFSPESHLLVVAVVASVVVSAVIEISLLEVLDAGARITSLFITM